MINGISPLNPRGAVVYKPLAARVDAEAFCRGASPPPFASLRTRKPAPAAARISDFKRNEFDLLLDDIRDVANREIAAELDKGVLVIDTVGDYCNTWCGATPSNQSR